MYQYEIKTKFQKHISMLLSKKQWVWAPYWGPQLGDSTPERTHLTSLWRSVGLAYRRIRECRKQSLLLKGTWKITHCRKLSWETIIWNGPGSDHLLILERLPDSLVGKESACNAGDQDLIPGLGRSPGEGKGNPLQYSGLENSMDCIVHGVAKSWTQLSDFHFTYKNKHFNINH